MASDEKMVLVIQHIEERIKMNKQIIKETNDAIAIYGLECENTGLELVLMLLEKEMK